ncbi:hypothetical protein EPN16_05400 [bacterium]|nr:MAG: hypothetical protein EPN16_05400 [bacterium]
MICIAQTYGKNSLQLVLCCVFLCLFASVIFAQDQAISEVPAKEGHPVNEEERFAGRFFDVQVPRSNYLFVKGVLTIFGTRGGPQPATPEEEEMAVWDELLLSYEAFRRGIQVNQDEVNAEIGRMFQEEKAGFDWKTDKDAYEKWLKEKAGVTAELFENQIRHLLQIQNLRQRIMDDIVPDVSKREAFQEFLNEHNSLNVELAEFGEKKAAEEFYKKAIRDPGLWDEERGRRPKDFKQIGLVSLEFLMDIWRFPKDAVYGMMKMKKNTLHPPEPIYKGYGVFKVLETRPASDKDFSKIRDSYYEQIKIRKKYKGLGEWFENLKKQSNIIIYPKI